jgi:hypothetical protein
LPDPLGPTGEDVSLAYKKAGKRRTDDVLAWREIQRFARLELLKALEVEDGDGLDVHLRTASAAGELPPNVQGVQRLA